MFYLKNVLILVEFFGIFLVILWYTIVKSYIVEIVEEKKNVVEIG